MSAPDFDLDGALFRYIGARGRAPEDDICEAIQAQIDDLPDYDGPATHDRLFDLVTAKRLQWSLPRGGDAMSTPLVYSLAKGRRS